MQEPPRDNSTPTPQNAAPQGQQPPQAPRPMGPPPPPGYGRPAAGPPPQGVPPWQQPQYGRPPQGPPPLHGQRPPGQWGPPPGQWSPQGPPPQVPGGPVGRPPFNAPDPRRMKRSPVPLIIGLIVLFFVVTMGLVALLAGPVLSGGMSSGGFSLPFGQRIAILEVEGVLGEGPGYGADTKRLREAVERWTNDASIKGMVIRINSPGGGVSATQDLYHAVEKFAAEKPVVVSMGDVAASGGYYLAMAADEVYANSGTLTGSVGVILSFWGYQDLTDKIGIEPRTVKSGQFKDIGSGARPMTEEEKVLLDDMIQDVYEQFYEVVYDGRAEIAREVIAFDSGRPVADISNEEVDAYLRSYCDGRIFSGNQALEYGMVDQLGTLDEAIEAMKLRLGITEEVHLVRTPKPQAGLFGKMNQKLEQLGNAAPGSVKLEFRFSM